MFRMDPVELRLKNVLREGSLLTTQTPIPPGVSIAEVIEAAAQAAGWGTSREPGRPTVDVFAQRIVAWHAMTSKVTDLVLTPLRIALWDRHRGTCQAG